MKIEIELELLKNLFDLAVGSMDWGSGFWDDEDTACGRAVAELIGVDPIVATPYTYRDRFRHTYTQYDPALTHPFPETWANRCRYCNSPREAEIHQS